MGFFTRRMDFLNIRKKVTAICGFFTAPLYFYSFFTIASELF